MRKWQKSLNIERNVSLLKGFQRQNFGKKSKIKDDSGEERRKSKDKILNKEGRILMNWMEENGVYIINRKHSRKREQHDLHWSIRKVCN